MFKATSDSRLSREKPVVDWTDICVGYLIDGHSLNLVGLDGSGRSHALRLITEALDSSDWRTLLWTPDDLVTRPRREIGSAIDSLSSGGRYPVLLFDDFGEFLMTRKGRWLEQMLFSRVFGNTMQEGPSLRCVVVTHPRDREIVGPSSGLRERARYIHPPMRTVTAQEMEGFGCANAEELLKLTGYNSHLLSVTGDTSQARRDVAKSKAHEWLPRWIGQLDIGHQNRLGEIIGRAQPPRWRREDGDASLMPIVTARQSASPGRCAITDCIRVADLRQLLVGQPWPECVLEAAVRRFCARNGNDPNPLWVDNFLSDTRRLDFGQLVDFLEMMLSNLPGLSSIRILSRNWVGDHRVYASDIETALRQTGISHVLASRLQWRLYDRQGDVNLHRRELILSTRRAAFSLPPAAIVTGQDAVGNEADAAVAFASSEPASRAWNGGVPVPIPG